MKILQGDQTMAIDRILSRVAIAGLLSIVFIWGCEQGEQGGQKAGPAAQPKQPPVEAAKAAPKAAESATVELALKPAAGEQTKYMINTHSRRSIKWQGPVPKKEAFEESFNEDKLDMAVTQRTQSVDANGVVDAQVTIDSLKYLSIIKNFTNVEFDSSKQADASNPLAKLIGLNYTIEFEPNNSMLTIAGLTTAGALLNGQTSADRAGQNILAPETIKERHGALLLPPKGRGKLKPGDKWSIIKTYSFGLMGLKSYEKIYTLKEVRNVAGHRIAVVEMNAIPSSEVESKFRNQQAGANFPKMFDTNEMYSGGGEVDLTAGRIDSYSESLHASWIAALPPNPGESADANEPVVLKMTATRDYKIEKIK
jgi:hypothetical protein